MLRSGANIRAKKKKKKKELRPHVSNVIQTVHFAFSIGMVHICSVDQTA